MTCRSTRVGSASTSFAILATGCEERQVLSMFHELQREGRAVAAPTADQVADLIAQQRDWVDANPDLSAARRASLHARLDAAATEPMDGRTFYAATRILDRAQRASTAIGAYLDRTARATGRSTAEIRTDIDTDMAEAHADRTLAAPRQWVTEFAARPENANLPLDRITAYAMHQAETRANAAVAAAPTRPTVTHHPVDSSLINTIGYDPGTGHLEVELHSRPGVRYAYRVPQDVYAEMTANGQSVGSYWSRNIRRNPDFLYSTQDDATAAGTLTQCNTCGQFAGAGHACPTRGSARERAATARRAAATLRNRAQAATQAMGADPAATDQVAADLNDGRAAGERLATTGRSCRRYAGESGVFSSVNLTDLQATARRNGTLHTRVSSSISRVATEQGATPSRGYVNGLVNVTYLGRGRGYAVTPVTNSSDDDRLRCNCADYRDRYDCVHVRQTVQDVQNRLNQDRLRDRHAIGEAIQSVTADLAQDRAESVQAQAESISNWGDPASSPVRYSEDPAAFQADYKAAKDRIAAGQPAVEYMTENATDGLGARGTGRAFGVELEFDIQTGDRYTALRNIGRDLHAAGLTSSPEQTYYHAGQSRGYTENHNGGWSFESDCTVAGELVSPIMYDTPETWENLAKACEIIKRHGGRATVRAGSHVHVSAGNYDHTVENHNRLLNSFQEYQDVLYRLSTNPERGTHRGGGYCVPNRAPATGYRDVSEAQWGNGHGMGLNMQSVNGRNSDHVEFRTWDATLDPAVIQTQIKVSLAMTESAFRDRTRTPGPAEPVGTHRAHNRREHGASRRLTGEAWQADTASFRQFADQMFRRPADKAQVAALFAATKWQRNR